MSREQFTPEQLAAFDVIRGREDLSGYQQSVQAFLVMFPEYVPHLHATNTFLMSAPMAQAFIYWMRSVGAVSEDDAARILAEMGEGRREEE